MSYEVLMPTEAANGTIDQQNWKATKRELAALDILNSNYLINPEEFIKTKHHCYIVKEYANGGNLAQLLLYRSQKSIVERSSQQLNKRLSELEMKTVITGVLRAVSEVYA